MPTLVPDLELKTEIDLLCALHRECHRLALPKLATTGIGVERERGVNQIAMMLQDTLDPFAVGLFVSGQDDDQIALGDEAFLLITNEAGHQHGRAGFIVAASPSVVVPIFFGEGEWINRPVLSPGGNDVEVSHQEDWLGPAPASPIAHHQIFDAWSGLYDLH